LSGKEASVRRTLKAVYVSSVGWSQYLTLVPT